MSVRLRGVEVRADKRRHERRQDPPHEAREAVLQADLVASGEAEPPGAVGARGGAAAAGGEGEIAVAAEAAEGWVARGGHPVERLRWRGEAKSSGGWRERVRVRSAYGNFSGPSLRLTLS